MVNSPAFTWSFSLQRVNTRGSNRSVDPMVALQNLIKAKSRSPTGLPPGVLIRPGKNPEPLFWECGVIPLRRNATFVNWVVVGSTTCWKLVTRSEGYRFESQFRLRQSKRIMNSYLFGEIIRELFRLKNLSVLEARAHKYPRVQAYQLASSEYKSTFSEWPAIVFLKIGNLSSEF